MMPNNISTEGLVKMTQGPNGDQSNVHANKGQPCVPSACHLDLHMMLAMGRVKRVKS